MFKRATSIFILVLLMLTNFSRLIIYAEFELNQKYIAVTLCDNRDKPELHCDGKCYLAKKIKQADDKEKKQELGSQKKSAYDNYIVKIHSAPQLFSIEMKKQHFLESAGDLPNGNSEVLDPPPSLSFLFS